MWKWPKKAKDIFSWFSFVWHILGWLGLTAIVSGVAVAAIGVVGAVIKGVPWPLVLMAAYCTIVGMAYLAAFPIFVRALGSMGESNEGGKERLGQRWHLITKLGGTLIDSPCKKQHFCGPKESQRAGKL
jgi:hypothetical protein